MNGKSVLLVGATGLVGNECLLQLSENDYYDKVVVLTRRPLQESLILPKVENHVIDFNEPESYKDLVSANHVICTLGTTIKKAGSKENFYRVDYTYPYEVALAALEKGAEHFLIITAIGSDAKSKFFYNRVKGEIENSLMKMEYSSVSIFRPSLLLGKRNEFRLGEWLLNITMGPLSFLIPPKYRPVTGHNLAEVIINTGVENRPGIRILESVDIINFDAS